jgi:hypothetical protein
VDGGRQVLDRSSADTGKAASASPKDTVVSESCCTNPATNRLPACGHQFISAPHDVGELDDEDDRD